jgi:hypothetical protein
MKVSGNQNGETMYYCGVKNCHSHGEHRCGFTYKSVEWVQDVRDKKCLYTTKYIVETAVDEKEMYKTCW